MIMESKNERDDLGNVKNGKERLLRMEPWGMLALKKGEGEEKHRKETEERKLSVLMETEGEKFKM